MNILNDIASNVLAGVDSVAFWLSDLTGIPTLITTFGLLLLGSVLLLGLAWRLLRFLRGRLYLVRKAPGDPIPEMAIRLSILRRACSRRHRELANKCRQHGLDLTQDEEAEYQDLRYCPIAQRPERDHFDVISSVHFRFSGYMDGILKDPPTRDDYDRADRLFELYGNAWTLHSAY